MVEIYFVELNAKHEFLNGLMCNSLPDPSRKRAMKFHNAHDQLRYSLGKHLIAWTLSNLGYSNQDCYDLQIDKYKRPFINREVDFNISHSGNYVLCAISRQGRIGADIEEIQPIDMNEFISQFHPNELTYIKSSEDPNREFYRIWTKKEAVIKANGKGLELELGQIDTTSFIVTCEGKEWAIQDLDIDHKYCGHIASEATNLHFTKIKVAIEDLVLFANSSSLI